MMQTQTHGHRRWQLAPLVVALCGAGCATVDFASFERAHLPDVDNADLVVVQHDERVRFGLDDAGRPVARSEVRRQQWARTETGAEDAQLVMLYDGSFDDDVHYDVRVVSGTDDQRVFTKGDMSDISFNGSVISDARFLVPPVGLVEGDVVDEHQRKHKRKADVFAHSFVFGHPKAHVVRSSFAVCAPTGWDVTFHVTERNAKVDWAPERSDGAETCWTFTKENLAPVDDEDDGPDWLFSTTMVSTMLTQWTDAKGTAHTIAPTPERMSSTLAALYKDPNDEYGDVTVVTPKLKQRAAEVVRQAGAQTDRDKAAVLYNFVQTSVEYCAIELGMGGWKPYSAASVDEKGYGDCKDKANYLAALLSAVGIRSSSTGIYSHRGMPKRFGLPAVAANFNHAILAVHLDDGDVYVDPTTRAVPFGQLPINDEDADVLQFADPGKGLDHTGVQGADVHKLKLEAWFDVQPGTDGRFEAHLDGHYAVRARMGLLYRPQAAWHQVGSEVLERVGRDCHVEDAMQLEHMDPTPLPTTLVMRGKIEPKRGRRYTSGYVPTYSTFLKHVLPLPTQTGDRHTPVLLHHLRREEDVVHVELNNSWKVRRLAEPYQASTPWFDVDIGMQHEGDEVIVHRTLTVKKTRVTSAEFAAYKKAVDELHVAMRRRMHMRVKKGGQ